MSDEDERVLDIKEIDVQEGDVYRFLEKHFSGTFKFKKKPRRFIVFENVESKEEKQLSVGEFNRMRGEGTCVRTVRAGLPIHGERLTAFELLDPAEDGIGRTEKAKRERYKRKVVRAMTLQFYAQQFDDDDEATTYEPTLRLFINANYSEAKERGLVDYPSTSSVRKALAKYGAPNNRPLGSFVDLRGKHKRDLWEPWIVDLKKRMIEDYWKPRIAKVTVQSQFIDSFEVQRIARGLPKDFVCPSPSTLNDWINSSLSQENLARKTNNRIAHKRFVGTVASIQATRPLQYVILDQTEVDLGLHIKNSAGELIRVQRAYLVYAMDVFSKMILGFYLSLEPPSVFTLMKCIKQIVLYKNSWAERFNCDKGACDGFGWFNWLVLDNGLENVGVSLRTAMAKLGADIMYAAVRTPEHKAHVERMFGITNNLWHQLPGGINLNPMERRRWSIDPLADSKLTLPEATDKLIEFIVTVYHVEDPRGRRMAPARKWAEGIQAHGRRTLDDARALIGILGKYHRAVLTTSGVEFSGEVFHDHKLTTCLMRDLLKHQRKRQQRDFGQTGVCRVNVFYDPMDCADVYVHNTATGELVKLPNIHRDACIGLSFAQGANLRRYAREQALRFHSTVERAQARAKLFGEAVKSAMTQKKPTKKQTRTIHAEQIALNPEAEVVEAFEAPSVMGRAKTISTTAPASRALDHGLSPKDPVRGKRRPDKAAGSAEETKRQTVNKIKASAMAEPPQHPLSYVDVDEDEDAAALVQRLLAQSGDRW